MSESRSSSRQRLSVCGAVVIIISEQCQLDLATWSRHQPSTEAGRTDLRFENNREGDDLVTSEAIMKGVHGWISNLKKLGPLMADNLVPVTITSGRMWRDASSKLDIGLNVDATLWFVVPHSFHRMTVEELLRMYAAGDRKSVFNLLLLAGGPWCRGMPWVADIERLVHTDPRDEEIKASSGDHLPQQGSVRRSSGGAQDDSFELNF